MPSPNNNGVECVQKLKFLDQTQHHGHAVAALRIAKILSVHPFYIGILLRFQCLPRLIGIVKENTIAVRIY